MSNNRTVLSDADHQNLSSYSVEMLLACRSKMKLMEKLYDLEKIDFPTQCRTNFRDAWFHYKKVYERFDSIKVYQEQYAMEEHLIRILKDAITVLFNKYAYWIENVYYLLEEKQAVLGVLTTSKVDEFYSECIDIRIDSDYWYNAIQKRICKEKGILDKKKDAAIKDVTLRLFLEQADIKAYRVVLQECMHKIKNYSLRTRLEGIEIYRPENSDAYLDDCADVFGDILFKLKEHRIYSVLPQFSSFYVNCCNEKCKTYKRNIQKASVISCHESKCPDRGWKGWSDLYIEEDSGESTDLQQGLDGE